ncbi:MAG: NnrS family protein, partial [Gammaproteobacteria bacterium]|nr:NnrS family protein [Gammaproteobacteria bacterium]
MSGRSGIILSIAFRPFFLLGGIFAVVSMLLWIATLHGAGWQPAVADPVAWHAHEMLFGFAGAAMAGFLLTAVATWTGRPPVSGATLGTLVAAWIAGRVAMAAGH